MRFFALLAAAICAYAAGPSALVDRVGSTGFVQLEAESFQKLSPRQQTLAYWLTQASIAIDPIIYDQNSVWGLRQKRLLEGLMLHPEGQSPALRNKVSDFAKLFWANRGNHNDTTAQKFLPDLSFEELKTAAHAAFKAGAFQVRGYGVNIADEGALDRELEALRPSLFDPDFEPMITAKSPRGALDILQASANNFYHGVTLGDLKNFREEHPLNSRKVTAVTLSYPRDFVKQQLGYASLYAVK